MLAKHLAKTQAVCRRFLLDSPSEAAYHRMKQPLLLSHQFTYSGAPLALLAMARAMRRMGYQPAVAALQDGTLKTDFIAAGCEVWTRIDPRRVAFVVANTILTLDIALRLRRTAFPWRSGYMSPRR